MPAARTIRISKLFTLEMGHALLGHDGQCRNIHGHSYKLSVMLKGIAINQPGNPKDGMVMDFTDLKKIVQQYVIDPFDHALVLNKSTPEQVTSILTGNFEKTMIVPFQPTCENLLLYFVERIGENLPASVELYRVRLDETATSFAEWCAED